MESARAASKEPEAMREPMLYACAQLPWPLDGGHKIVSYNDIRYLSEVFDLTVLSFVDEEQWGEREDSLGVLRERLPGVHFLEPVAHSIHTGGGLAGKALQFLRALRSGYPYIVSKYRNEAYLEALHARLRTGDYPWLFVESTPLGYLVRELPPELREGVRLVFRPHDMLSETLSAYAQRAGLSPSGLAARFDARVCRRFEHWLWRESDALLPVTRRLGKLITVETGIREARIHYFPVYVDGPYAAPVVRERAQTVFYVGTTRYPPNRQGLEWFIRACWPSVRAAYPDAKLLVVGRGSRQLAVDDASIELHDYVEDLEPYYQRADVFVVPLFSGSGIRLKVLEAMKRGLPVVSTTPGYEGLELMPEEHLLVRDSADGFAEGVIGMLQSRERRQQLVERARSFLLEAHDPSLAAGALENLRSRFRSGHSE